ncbi:MAG: GGDEF domain-containing protein [Oscillospiraceae bacterium]
MGKLLSAKKTIKIAVVSGDSDSAYTGPLVTMLCRKFEKLGYHILWFHTISDEGSQGTPHEVGENNIYNLINYDAIDALIMLTLTIKSDSVKKSIAKKAALHCVPVISLDEYVEGAFNISFDYNESLRDIVDHVIEVHGRKKLAFIRGDRGNYVSDQREKIFREVLEEHDIPVDESLIGTGYFWHEAAESVFEKWYKSGNIPDAVICANDSMAIGVCRKVDELGLSVPDDVIVTGVDGIPEAMSYNPSITTARTNMNEAAEYISDTLYKILNGEISPVGTETIKAERRYARSCGCVSAVSARSLNDNMHELYDDINRFKFYAKSVITTADEVKIDSDFAATVKKMDVFLKKIWAKHSWLCICDDFYAEMKDSDDISQDYSFYRTNGYSDRIGYGVEYDDETKKSSVMLPFATAELIPDLDNVLKTCKNIMFLPIHFQDKSIGFLAVEFTQCLGNYNVINTFDCGVISLVLENARVQATLHSFLDKLEEMYIRDPLTTLLNRRGFFKFAQKAFEDSRASGREFIMISIDLDYLKTINDTYGHDDGDFAIKTMAKAISEASESRLFTARFGGDEYVAAGMSPHEGFDEEYVAKLKECLERLNSVSGKPYKVGASIGVYKAVPAENDGMDVFIKEADHLMYADKKRRKAERK